MPRFFKRFIASIAAIFALGAAQAQPIEFPPRPKWKPTVPVDIERTVKTMAYYTDNKRSFAVFTNGTCMLVPENVPSVEGYAKEALHKIFYAHPDMNPRPMDDGNWMITYSQPAASIVFASEVDENWVYIDKNHMDGLATAEVLLNAQRESNKFDRLGKIALFGRSRMFMDAINPVVIGVYRPNIGFQPTVPASGGHGG